MPEPLLLERVQHNCARLQLARMAEVLAATLQGAEAQGHSPLRVLDSLLEEEVAAKDQRRLEATVKLAGLPFVKTLEEFDFTFQPQLDRAQVLPLFDLTFLTRQETVVFLGPPGVGKTHLAIALALKACQAGQTIAFTTMADLMAKLAREQATGRHRSYGPTTLVVVDEVGYTPITREECHLFYRFVAARYEKASTILTSNKAFGEWAELFHDPVLVTAILDRLLHHSVVINIRGHSYRLKGKLGKEGTDPTP